MNNHQCVVCGVEVIPTKWKNSSRISYSKFCSEKCRGQYLYKKHYSTYQKRWLKDKFKWQVERECTECKKTFLPKTHSQLRCSDACILQYKLNWKRENRKKKRTELVCKWCKKEFMPTNGQQIYCDKQCMTYGYSKSKYPGLLQDEVIADCDYCGQEFVMKRTTHLYCGQRCRNLRYKDLIRFPDGSSSKTKNKFLRLEMDNHTCQRCEATEQLIVHHNRYPATIEHLITLCRSCHAYIHKKEGGIFYPTHN